MQFEIPERNSEMFVNQTGRKSKISHSEWTLYRDHSAIFSESMVISFFDCGDSERLKMSRNVFISPRPLPPV